MHGKSLPKGKARGHGITAPGVKRGQPEADSQHPEFAPPGRAGRPEGFTSRGKQRQGPPGKGFHPES